MSHKKRTFLETAPTAFPQAKGDAVTLFSRFTAHVGAAIDALAQRGVLPGRLDHSSISVEPPRDPSHGDIATNAAMVLARTAGMKPRVLAALLSAELEKLDEVVTASLAGPGFINMIVSDDVWRDELVLIARMAEDYGRSSLGRGRRVNVEYVSANPTGPLHVGHCRGAIVGDALATLLEYVGYEVTREYYINDAGAQVDILARSVHRRYCEALGKASSKASGENVGAIPEDLYPGEYLKPVGAALAKQYGDAMVDVDEQEWLAPFRSKAVSVMMALIRGDLDKLGIRHDIFSSEAALHATGKPVAAEARLRASGLVYDGVLETPKGGAAIENWEAVELPLFRSTRFGDDQDRAIRKADGSWTYFGTDLAYHYEKAQRADELVDIWGADHAGTVRRIKAAVAVLTGEKLRFDVKLVQMVRLFRNGQPFKMSKRAGNFVTLADVVDEVGKDVVRFTMLTRKADAPMDFDFARVVEFSKDNPVFYVHYAHARIHSLKRKIASANTQEAGIATEADRVDLSLLSAEEIILIKLIAQFPRTVEAAALHREPHRVAFFLTEVAAAFHSWWNRGNEDIDARIFMVSDSRITAARLFLAEGVGQVIRNGLMLMGVTAVEEMGATVIESMKTVALGEIA